MESLSELIKTKKLQALHLYKNDPNLFYPDENTLNIALHYGHPTLIELALEIKAPINEDTLGCAFLNGDFKVIERIIKILKSDRLDLQPNSHSYNCALLNSHPKIIEIAKKLGLKESSYSIEDTLKYMIERYGPIGNLKDTKDYLRIKPFSNYTSNTTSKSFVSNTTTFDDFRVNDPNNRDKTHSQHKFFSSHDKSENFLFKENNPSQKIYQEDPIEKVYDDLNTHIITNK